MQEEKDKVLLFGYRKYGDKIAKELIKDDYYVVIVENDDIYTQKAIKNGYKAYTVDIDHDEDIVQILVSHDFDHIFCAMDSDEVNIYLAITIKSLQDNVDIISICESKDSEKKLELAGVRGILNTMDATAQGIYHILKSPVMIEAVENILYFNSDIDFVELKVPKDSFLDGKFVNEIDFKKEYNLILMGLVDKEVADNFIFITKGVNHKIDDGDILLLFGFKEDIKILKDKLLQGILE